MTNRHDEPSAHGCRPLTAIGTFCALAIAGFLGTAIYGTSAASNNEQAPPRVASAPSGTSAAPLQRIAISTAPAQSVETAHSRDQEASARHDDKLPPIPRAAPSVDRLVRTLNVGKGDTLMDVMVRAGADRRHAHAAITALSKYYNPRRLRPGQDLTLTFVRTDADGPIRLHEVNLDAGIENNVVARRDGPASFQAESIEKTYTRRGIRASGVIEDSLFLAAKRAKVPPAILLELIRLYSFDVDFQRDIQPGDSFEAYFEALQDDGGTAVDYDEILYARLRVGGTDLPLYRFELADGTVDYFNEKGHSVRKALMKTPVDGARLSSRYGRRKHPILRYTKMHRGVDFAASAGTPVMAAGTGRIELAGRNGAYGKYIRIRHNSEYKTAYAHLSGYARGIRRGKRVRQGQIIGYVGSTGRSTGPHLHYEVLRHGRQTNPLGLKLPTGQVLTGKALATFQSYRAGIEQRMAAAPHKQMVAGGN